MITKTIVIPNMVNQQDADQVNRALYNVWGVGRVDIILARREAMVQYEELATSFDEFEQAIVESGYKVGGVTEFAGDM